jgi:hypothetical protein
LNNALAAGTGFATSVHNMKFPMKVNRISTKKLAILSAAFCAAMLAFSPKAAATALTFNDAHVVGTMTPGPVNLAVVSASINYMVALAPGDSGTFHNPPFAQTITRSSNTFASLPNALVPGAVTGFSTTINLGAGVYSYLFAKYDGQNDLSQVWYVGNLSGIVTIPALGPSGHALTRWKLFPGGQVPDGGTTVMLLGAALGALGMARRFLKS